jgi:hypothetical protein
MSAEQYHSRKRDPDEWYVLRLIELDLVEHRPVKEIGFSCQGSVLEKILGPASKWDSGQRSIIQEEMEQINNFLRPQFITKTGETAIVIVRQHVGRPLRFLTRYQPQRFDIALARLFLILLSVGIFLWLLLGNSAGQDIIRASEESIWESAKLSISMDIVGVIAVALIMLILQEHRAEYQSFGSTPITWKNLPGHILHEVVEKFKKRSSLTPMDWSYLSLTFIIGIILCLISGVIYGLILTFILLILNFIMLPIAFVLLNTVPQIWIIVAAAILLLFISRFPVLVGYSLGSPLSVGCIVALWIIFIVFLGMLRRRLNIRIFNFISAFVVLFMFLSLFVGALWDEATNTVNWSWLRNVIQTDIKQEVPSLLPIDEAYKLWLGRRPTGAPSQLVLVAAAGGGIRASYWTSLVLSEIARQAPSFREKLFLASGVSGGSLGLAVYSALIHENNLHCSSEAQTSTLKQCVQLFHQSDFLAAPLTASLTGTPFNAILPVRFFPSSVSALEQSWEKVWRQTTSTGTSQTSDTFSKPFVTHDKSLFRFPALVLNATSAKTGDRLPISQISTDDWIRPRNPCSVNIAAHASIPLSVAASVSARFPYLAEAAWFYIKDPDYKCERWRAAVDGGYYDNFGAATADDALTKITQIFTTNGKPHVIVIQITSDPELDGPPSEVAEPATPPHISASFWDRLELLRFWDRETRETYSAITSNYWTLLAAKFGFGSQANGGLFEPIDILQRARSITGTATMDKLQENAVKQGASYYHFSMAGAKSVPLSWSLSRSAMRDLDTLLQSSNKNAEHMEQLVKQLNGS